VAESATERRRYTRRDATVFAWLRFPEGRGLYATTTLDVSEGGARFNLMQPVNKGEKVLLMVQLQPGKPALECKGLVAWTEQEHHFAPHSFAVRFVDLFDEERDQIRERLGVAAGATAIAD
jgi:PilZ domain-containing protein